MKTHGEFLHVHLESPVQKSIQAKNRIPREVAVPVRPSIARAGPMTLDGRIACCEEGIDHPIQVARRTLESRGVLDSVAFRAVACTASIGRAVGMLDS